MTDEILVQGTLAKFQSLVDGTVRIIVDTHTPSEAMALLQAGVGQAVVVAPLTEPPSGVCDGDSKEQAGPEVSARPSVPDNKGPYSAEAQALWRMGFFNIRQVWKAAGTDAQYLEWLKGQPCVVHGKAGCPSENYVDGKLQSIPCHVRITDDKLQTGSGGTGIKPEYSAASVCNTAHQRQHQHGYDAVLPKSKWISHAHQQVTQWASETIKEDLGRDHWHQVAPVELLQWCAERGVDKSWLPRIYRDAA